MHELDDKQLQLLRERCESGLRQAKISPPRDPLQVAAYVILSFMAMTMDSEIARRRDRGQQQRQG